MKKNLNYASPNAADTREQAEIRAKGRSKDYFFCETVGKYVAYEPIKVDDRVVKAAHESGIELSWDDEGRINNISFIDAKRLSKALGASFLSPAEYWRAMADARQSGNDEFRDQLQSDSCTEWLDAVYCQDEAGHVVMIEHPELVDKAGGVEFIGEKKLVAMPDARPGWFNPEGNIDPESGLPYQVETAREKGTPGWSSANWKYWSVFKTNEAVAPIRGYVTSSGTPSLDLDIPVAAVQPVLMLRECRSGLLAPEIDPELIARAQGFIEAYAETAADEPARQNPEVHQIFYDRRRELLDFWRERGREIIGSKAKEAKKIKEKFIDMLGLIRIMAQAREDQPALAEVDSLAQEFFGISPESASFEAFRSYVRGSQNSLREGLKKKEPIVFVMGHKNPDSDTAVSCLAEAFRNQLLDRQARYVPVLQGERIPDEIRRLLGDELADSLLLSDQKQYDQALKSGQARWILVDQNVSEVQRFAISLVDHHLLADKTKRQDIGKTWEMAGSTTALVAQKYSGMGIDLDPALARIFYGATLMDTENRSDKKMTYKDGLVMDGLKDKSAIISDDEFFQDLMSCLLNTDDAELLFNRDYKQDWGIFGYAVAKTKGAFGAAGEAAKQDLLDRLVNLAEENNRRKNFPLTIVKIADYFDDNETVNKERVYLIFNRYVLPEFKQAMFDFVSRIIEHEFQGRAAITRGDNFVDFGQVGDQLSRKVTAPFFEPVVEAFNKFYFSPETGLYVRRDFTKMDGRVKQAAEELGLELTQDKEGRINNITYHEARALMDHLGQTMMSLSEYWKILSEAVASHDEQMMAHLRSPGFVEFLDTVILDGRYIIDHPKIIKTGQGCSYEGERKEADIPEGVPGLIYPEDIDPATGFPRASRDPRQYGDKRLWRYWSPDAPVCVATRGHIFLINQTSFDTKIHPDDALPNLGMRPCTYKVIPPQVEISADQKGVKVKIA